MPYAAYLAKELGLLSGAGDIGGGQVGKPFETRPNGGHGVLGRVGVGRAESGAGVLYDVVGKDARAIWRKWAEVERDGEKKVKARYGLRQV